MTGVSGMSGMSLREARESAGLTQRELAELAGVSRQLVSAVEHGRHLPRVDAALSLAGVLGIEVGRIFGSSPDVVDASTGDQPTEGALVRLGRVGERWVTDSVRSGATGFEPADAAVVDGELRHLARLDPGVVVLGCEPGLVVLEQTLRERGIGALSVFTSSARAVEALVEGRAHAAVVHGPEGSLPPSPSHLKVARYGMARWRVGLAAPGGMRSGWWEEALHGAAPVVQREPGAGVQRTFERARTSSSPAPGPVVATHLEAARRAVLTGLTAVTIEPAALALGASFHALDIHVAELWVDDRWLDGPQVHRALDAISGRRFQRRLEAVGGYDLVGCGVRVA